MLKTQTHPSNVSSGLSTGLSTGAVGRLLATAALTCAVAVAGPTQTAQAQELPDCTTLPNAIYFPATTLLQSLMDKVGPILSNPSQMGFGNNITVVYFPKSSCVTYNANRLGELMTGEATYYSTSGEKRTCRMPENHNFKADLSAMDVGGATCVGELAVPSFFKEFPSYVETLGFVVPRSSSQNAITASEGYYLMRHAARAPNQVAPWTNADRIHVRTGGSSTQLTVGANIGLSGKNWNVRLQSNAGSSAVRDQVAAANNTAFAEETIGILNSSKWEAKAADMKVLAFQPFYGCRGAFYPDSTPTARDKVNVRDGHYPIWTNLRFVARVDSSGLVDSLNGSSSAARAKRFIDLMTGIASDPALPVSDFVIETGNIPNCAMYVKRDVDGGPITSFDHPAPCHCSFLAARGINDASCVSCTSDATCGGGTCRKGFCEDR